MEAIVAQRRRRWGALAAVAACLISAGAERVQADPGPGTSPLDQAIARDDVAGVTAALAADPEGRLERVWGPVPLLQAVEADKLDVVQALLAAGADPNRISALSENTPLSGALTSWHIPDWKALADLLLAHGAKVDFIESHGYTPLFDLIRTGPEQQTDKVQYLLAHGASPSYRTDKGETASSRSLMMAPQIFPLLAPTADLKWRSLTGDSLLSLAVQQNNLDAVELLLERNADPNSVDLEGESPLHLAVAQPGPIVKLLLGAGANPNLRDVEGDTPLNLALRRPHKAAPAYTLWGYWTGPYGTWTTPPYTPANAAPKVDWLSLPPDESANPRDSLLAPLVDKSDVSLKDSYGISPLLSADLGRDQEARDLIVDANPHEDATTQLFDAVSQGDLPAVKALLAKKPYLVYLRLPEGSTALHVAALWGTAGAAGVLLNAGADVNARNLNGDTPLELALERPWGLFRLRAVTMEHLLMQHGADVNAVDVALVPVLAEAASAPQGSELLLPLLRPGTKVDIRDPTGATPLMLAVADGAPLPVVQALLAAGADVNLQDRDGATALMRAVSAHRVDLVKELLGHGADVSLHDQNGMWALLELSHTEVGQEQASVQILNLLLPHDTDVSRASEEGNLLFEVLGDVGGGTGPGAPLFEALLKVKGINLEGAYGSYAVLHGAVIHDSLFAAKALLAAGANVNAFRNGLTPLDLAREKHSDEMVQLLLANGAK